MEECPVWQSVKQRNPNTTTAHTKFQLLGTGIREKGRAKELITDGQE